MRALSLLLLLLPGLARAEEPAVRLPDLLALGIGATDVISNRYSAADFRLEYRSGLSLLGSVAPWFTLRPWAGLEVTSRGSVWGGGGLLLDIPVGPISIVPQAGIGAYGAGNGKPLGSPLEFRTGLELAYRFSDASRLGVMFTHTSNAGVTRRNPGTESVTVNYQFPLRW